MEDITDGFLANATTNTALYGGAIELEYVRDLGGDVTVSVETRYNHLVANTFEASDTVLETVSDFGVLTTVLEADGPTGATAMGRELRWITFVTNAYFPGSANDLPGFDYFFELGGGVEIVDRAMVQGIEGISLRGSGLFGQDVLGWSLALKLEF